jgi:Tol biopolymer transport system component
LAVVVPGFLSSTGFDNVTLYDVRLSNWGITAFEGYSDSSQPAISANGRFVAFASDATK